MPCDTKNWRGIEQHWWEGELGWGGVNKNLFKGHLDWQYYRNCWPGQGSVAMVWKQRRTLRCSAGCGGIAVTTRQWRVLTCSFEVSVWKEVCTCLPLWKTNRSLQQHSMMSLMFFARKPALQTSCDLFTMLFCNSGHEASSCCIDFCLYYLFRSIMWVIKQVILGACLCGVWDGSSWLLLCVCVCVCSWSFACVLFVMDIVCSVWVWVSVCVCVCVLDLLHVSCLLWI